MFHAERSDVRLKMLVLGRDIGNSDHDIGYSKQKERDHYLNYLKLIKLDMMKPSFCCLRSILKCFNWFNVSHEEIQVLG